MICPAKSAQELLAEFRASGRQEPFEEIVRRYAAMVFHVCFQVLKNRHDAEDATQAVFLTLAVQGKTSKEIRNIGPWLQQVAKRLSLDLRKARKRRAAREHRHGIANSNGGSGLALGNSGLDNQELRRILSEELNQLAPKYRLPLILHYFGGLSREQMSEELGCKAATLGVRLHRGREMLAARLSQRGVALTAVGLGMLLSYMVREAVTENLIWSTSHVASQMAAGHPIGAGMVSARAMALARSAGNTLAIAKVKAIVASVLIAATAVAAGEVVSKVRPLDLQFQGPTSDGLLDLFRPRLPQLHSDATPAKPAPTPPAVVLTTHVNPTPVAPQIVAADSAVVFHPAAGAEWGGSILSGRWIGSATTTHIPGIAWSNPPPQAIGNSMYGGRAYAVGPVAAPATRPGYQPPPIPFMAPQNNAANSPYATVPPRPRRKAPMDQIQQRSMPVQDLPTEPMEMVAAGPKLFLEPASYDARSHPVLPPIVPPPTTRHDTFISSTGTVTLYGGELLGSRVEIATAFANGTGSSPHSVVSWDGESSGSTTLNFNSSGPVIVGTSAGHGHTKQPRAQDSQDDPIVLAKTAFEGISTITTGSGIIKGYGTAHAASELNQNGQVIADGGGEERTLDLSAVGTIKNSIENLRTGHNGWFAQNKGKLVLPAVAFNDGTATWGEDSADLQLDLINSVRLSVNPEIVGSIKLSLLSTDRTDYPELPASLKPIGLWQVEPLDLVLASVDVTIRYDVDLADDLRLNSGLNLWGYDGEWKVAEAGSVDSYNRIIRGRLGGVDYFAVAGSSQTPAGHITGTPEPTTMLGLVCAGLILARRRRR